MDEKLESAARIYEQKGFAHRSGFGRSPALLIVDMTNGFTDPASPLGKDVAAEIEAIQALLKAFRAGGRPVFYTVNLHDPDDPGGRLFAAKVPAIKVLQPGSRAVVVREAVGDRAAGPHENNLFDIDAKFGDVVSLSEGLAYLATLKSR